MSTYTVGPYRHCDHPGCSRAAVARGLCDLHYRRARRLGKLPPRLPRGKPAMERFLAKVDRTGDCWLWTGAVSSTGYGTFYRGPEEGNTLAHRWAYLHWVGPIPEGLHLDHFQCEVRRCVNPQHVRPVTPWENALRSDSPLAWSAAQTHCVHGHPFDAANTYIRKDGTGRMCRRCTATRTAAIKRRGRRGALSAL